MLCFHPQQQAPSSRLQVRGIAVKVLKASRLGLKMSPNFRSVLLCIRQPIMSMTVKHASVLVRRSDACAIGTYSFIAGIGISSQARLSQVLQACLPAMHRQLQTCQSILLQEQGGCKDDSTCVHACNSASTQSLWAIIWIVNETLTGTAL